MPCPRRSGSSAAAPSRLSSSTVTRPPLMPWPSTEPSTLKALAGKDPRRHVELDDADAGGLLLGADADGVDGDVRFAGQFLGRFGRCAGVLAAVADDHDAGDGRVPSLARRSAPGRLQGGYRCRPGRDACARTAPTADRGRGGFEDSLVLPFSRSPSLPFIASLLRQRRPAAAAPRRC